MYLLQKNSILDLAKELSKVYEIYGPIVEKTTGQTLIDKVDNLEDIDLTAPIPSLPPKHIIFPQIEEIISYKYGTPGGEIKIIPNYANTSKALFGLRSCDLAGLRCLDRFFLGQEFVDEFYRHHRSKMFIVTNTCIVPFKQCFCACTDSGPCAYEGFDLNLTDIGDYYLVETGSDKGNEFIENLNLERSVKDHADEKEKRVDRCLSLFEDIASDSKAWVSRVMNRVTTGFITEDVWENIGDQCFECGACSFVCPTCSCFNIVDVYKGNGASNRLRTWDSCSYEGYSRMAGGHNPRKPVEDRRNKRFFCKLSYSQSKKYLRPACVGCGRCVWVCPGDIGMPNVVTNIRREIHK